MKYGTEKTTHIIDEFGSTVTTINKIREQKVIKVMKQYRVRVKVADSKQEMTEYLNFSDMIREKKLSGLLVLKDEDMYTKPAFVVEYPKFDVDGTYFVEKSWCETA